MKFPTVLDLFPYTVAGQEIKVRSTDTRTEDQVNSLIQILGQRGVMLSHIRKLQGSGYPSSLFSLEPGIKGGSKLSKQTDDMEPSHEIVAAGDVIADIASEEGLIPVDSLADARELNNVNPTEFNGGDFFIGVETSNSDETSKVGNIFSSKALDG